MKTVLKIVVATVVVGSLSLATMTACVIHGTGAHFSLFGDNSSEKAERVDSRELNLEAGRKLSATTPHGWIRVHAVDGGSGSLRATVHAWAATQAEADDQLARTSVAVHETPLGFEIRLVVKDSESESSENAGSSSVDLEIFVPSGVLLDMKSSSGDVTADGTSFGDSRIESSYGSVHIENVTGAVVARSKSGNVTVENVRNGGVDASSGYGDVSVQDADGSGAVALTTSSGSLAVEHVRAKSVTAESGYGTVALKNVVSESECEAISKSGDVRASSVVAQEVRLKSGYGNVSVKESRGDMTVESSSGNLTIDGAGGRVTAKTGYGNVRVEGVLTGLSASSSSGDVNVTALEGSKVEGDWNVTSKYGRVRVAAPKDAAFDLVAKTNYGEIDLGYSVQVEPGIVKGGKEMRGKVNGGGNALHIESNSGNVSVQPLSK